MQLTLIGGRPEASAEVRAVLPMSLSGLLIICVPQERYSMYSLTRFNAERHLSRAFKRSPSSARTDSFALGSGSLDVEVFVFDTFLLVASILVNRASIVCADIARALGEEDWHQRQRYCTAHMVTEVLARSKTDPRCDCIAGSSSPSVLPMCSYMSPTARADVVLVVEARAGSYIAILSEVWSSTLSIHLD